MNVLPLSSATWRFRDAADKKGWMTARIPGCVHTDLLSAGRIPDPFWGENEAQLQWIEERDWEYEARFSVSEEMLEEEVVELVADGLDTVATVLVNGVEVGRSENMFLGYRWDVARQLRRGKNEVRIRFESTMKYIRRTRLEHQPREINDPVGRCTVIRKQQCQFGWDWGPRFVTAGVWRDLRIEGWTGNRLAALKVTQEQSAQGAVTLHLSPELIRGDPGATCRWALSLKGSATQRGEGTRLSVEDPQLWWPNGLGAQPLYELHVEVVGSNGQRIGSVTQRLGLRTVVLDRHEDEWGETFQFVVNGRPVFIKGANWIPAHSFVAGLQRIAYERDLQAAADAHMNMIRVWGGGIYESDHFYDLCDELGLLVWQDFMFACTLYPADDAFVRTSEAEVAYQAKRLRNRTCLALWCGNNEVYSCNTAELVDPTRKELFENYEKVFHRAIPTELAKHDAITPYWPGSPWRGDTRADHPAGEARGDTHYWDVWHGRFPVKDYERWNFRFVSEFGMQSYASPTTQATFCPRDDTNVFGVAMENHQKNRGGNQVILDYVSRRYRFPKSQEALIYLSQLNQAHCMQVGVEHYRRIMPRCMGAIYWQLNDCWPVASWSSIEFTGRWKALHHVARRFNAPFLVSAHIPGDEMPGIGNYRKSTVSEVHLYTSCDDPTGARGSLRWQFCHVDGRVVRSGSKRVVLAYGESLKQLTIDVAKDMEKHGRENLYLRFDLEVSGRCVSGDTAFLTLPRFVHLPKPKTTVRLKTVSPTETEFVFVSRVYQHRFWFDLQGIDFRASDNCFELYPGEPVTVRVTTTRKVSKTVLQERLTYMSVADTY